MYANYSVCSRNKKEFEVACDGIELKINDGKSKVLVLKRTRGGVVRSESEGGGNTRGGQVKLLGVNDKYG